MFFLGLVLFSKRVPPPPEQMWIFPLAILVFLLGAAGRFWASGFLVKNDALTTTGPYGRVRNPIYVSNLLLGAGLVLLSGHYWAVAGLVLLYVVCYAPGMRAEEENLRRRYGPAFDAYAEAVPLIVPRARVAPGYGGSSWRGPAYMENKEAFVTAGLLIGLGIAICRRLGAA